MRRALRRHTDRSHTIGAERIVWLHRHPALSGCVAGKQSLCVRLVDSGLRQNRHLGLPSGCESQKGLDGPPQTNRGDKGSETRRQNCKHDNICNARSYNPAQLPPGYANKFFSNRATDEKLRDQHGFARRARIPRRSRRRVYPSPRSEWEP